MDEFEAQVAEAMAALETGVADARGDNSEVGESDLYHDIAGLIAVMYPAEVGAEVRRRLGFDPEPAGWECGHSSLEDDYPDHPPVWRTP
jgi:hypothetical protein